MTLEQLRARLKEITGANDEIETKAKAENRQFTADELVVLEKNCTEAEGLVKQIEALERVKALKAHAAVPALATTAAVGAGTVPAAPAKALTTEDKIGITITALLKRHKEPYKSALSFLEDDGHKAIADEIGAFQKTLNTQASVQGGILIPTSWSNDMIELLRPSTSFLQGGPIRIPMPNGNYRVPKQASGATASYTHEAEPAVVTEPAFGELVMSVKTLAAVVPVTNDLLNYGGISVQGFVQTDLRNAMSEKMDSAAYRGDGQQGNPLGLFNVDGITSNAAINSTTPTVAQIDADLRKCLNGPILANLPLSNAAWVMNPITAAYLEDLRNTDGTPAYPSMQGTSKSLKGIRVLLTTNLPVNLGGGANEGFIALVSFGYVLLGESMPLELAVSSEAMLEIGATRISLFQRRMTAVLAVMQHDFGVRQSKAISLLTAVKWGR